MGVVLLVASLAVAGWNGYADRRLADRLEQQGVTVDARVVDLRHRGRLSAILGDEAEVVFTTEQGEQVQTWVVVGTSVDNGPVRVRYLRSDPYVARLRHDLKPRAGALTLMLVVTALVGFPTWLLVRWVRRNRDLD